MIGTSEEPVSKWVDTHVEFPLRTRKRRDGSIGEEGPPHINKGDIMVLYATGHKTLFAVGEVSRGAYDHTKEFKNEKRWGKWSVDLVYLRDPINPVTSGPNGPKLNKAFIGNQRGYKSITCEQYKQAAKALGVTPEDC